MSLRTPLSLSRPMSRDKWARRSLRWGWRQHRPQGASAHSKVAYARKKGILGWSRMSSPKSPISSTLTMVGASVDKCVGKKGSLPSEPTSASRGPGRKARWRSWSVKDTCPSTPWRRAFGVRPVGGVWAPMIDETRSRAFAMRRAAASRRLVCKRSHAQRPGGVR